MVFHIGVLWRLNEAGYLSKLQWISSVSGGSIIAGVLPRSWGALAFDQRGVSPRFTEKVVTPLRKMASTTIDEEAVLGGIFLPVSISDKVGGGHRKQENTRVFPQPPMLGWLAAEASPNQSCEDQLLRSRLADICEGG